MSHAKAFQVIRMATHPKHDDSSSRDSMRALLEDIVIRMVGTSKDIEVTYAVGEKTTIFKVNCPKESLGRLIGSKGKNISALRTVVSAMMWQDGIRAIIEIPYYKPDDK